MQVKIKNKNIFLALCIVFAISFALLFVGVSNATIENNVKEKSDSQQVPIDDSKDKEKPDKQKETTDDKIKKKNNNKLNADVQKKDETQIGYVEDESTGSKAYFQSASSLDFLCNDEPIFKTSKTLKVDISEDFNFLGDTVEFPENKTINFYIHNHKLYSKKDNEGETLFEVNGVLNIFGEDSANHGIIQEPSEDSAIFVDNPGTLNVSNIDFTYPDKENVSEGGHIYFDKLCTNPTFTNCNFSGYADEGGSIYFCESDDKVHKVEFNNCTFNGCKAESKGGAIYNDAESSEVDLNNCSFKNCTSLKDGGAVAVYGDYNSFYLYDTTFDSCHAKNNGGAFYIDGNSANIYGNFSFDYLHSDVLKDHNPQLTNHSVIKNCYTDTFHGGAIYTEDTWMCGNYAEINHIDFINNEAKGSLGSGGALSLEGSHNSVTNCYFKNNYAGYQGGAIYEGLDSEESKITNCVFDRNRSTGSEYIGRSDEVYIEKEEIISGLLNNRVYHNDSTFDPNTKFNKPLAEKYTGHFDIVKIKEYYQVEYNGRTIQVEPGGKIVPEEPKKRGYTHDRFEHRWNKDESTDLNYDYNYRIYYDFFVYDVCTPNIYKIDILNDDTASKQQIYEKFDNGFYSDSSCSQSSKIEKLVPPSKTGFYFEGYYTRTSEHAYDEKIVNSDGTFAVGPDKFAEDTSLYAKLVPVYKLTLDNNKADPEHQGTEFFYEKYEDNFYNDEKCEETFEGITIPEKEGFKFDGYYTKNGEELDKQILDAEGKLVEGIDAKEFSTSTTLYAKWTGNVYKITLDDGIGSGGSGQFYEKYNDGFYEDEACSKSKQIDPESYRFKIPENANYTFSGYYYDKAGDPPIHAQAIDEEGKLDTGITTVHFEQDTTLTALWQEGVYKISLDSNGSDEGHKGTDAFYEKFNKGFYRDAECQREFSPITLPQKTGYTFEGYFTKNGEEFDKPIIDIEGKLVEGIEPTEFSSTTTLYAKWTANIYKITLDDGAGSGGSGQFYEKYNDGFYEDEACSKSKQIVPANYRFKIPENANYTFSGYFYDKAGDPPIHAQAIDEEGKLDTEITTVHFEQDTTLTALWQEGVYKISLDSNGSDEAHKGTDAFYEKYNKGFYRDIECQREFSPITIPQKTGYKFEGYFTKNGEELDKPILDSDGKLVSGISPTEFIEPATLYAKWSPCSYNIIYKDKGGADFSGSHETGYPIIHTYDIATQLKKATKDGFIFKGWHKQIDCTDDAITHIGEQDISSDITLYADWESISDDKQSETANDSNLVNTSDNIAKGVLALGIIAILVLLLYVVKKPCTK